MHFITSIKNKHFKQNFKKINRSFNDVPISDIEIEVEELILPTHNNQKIILERPVSVSGVIVPTITKGRVATPNPVAFDSLGKYIKSIAKTKIFAHIAENSDRGHVMALQFGTPNEKYNVVPQWKGFQEHGDWRKLEKMFVNLATKLQENNNSLFLSVEIEYLNLNTEHLYNNLIKFFDYSNKDSFDEIKIQKCLQIFSIPTSYYYSAYPCSMYISKPKAHSLSVPYVKQLYLVAELLSKSKSKAIFKTKLKNVLKALESEWDLKEVKENDLINTNEDILSNVSAYIHEGTIALSAITEEDVS